MKNCFSCCFSRKEAKEGRNTAQSHKTSSAASMGELETVRLLSTPGTVVIGGAEERRSRASITLYSTSLTHSNRYDGVHVGPFRGSRYTLDDSIGSAGVWEAAAESYRRVSTQTEYESARSTRNTHGLPPHHSLPPRGVATDSTPCSPIGPFSAGAGAGLPVPPSHLQDVPIRLSSASYNVPPVGGAGGAGGCAPLVGKHSSLSGMAPVVPCCAPAQQQKLQQPKRHSVLLHELGSDHEDDDAEGGDLGEEASHRRRPLARATSSASLDFKSPPRPPSESGSSPRPPSSSVPRLPLAARRAAAVGAMSSGDLLPPPPASASPPHRQGSLLDSEADDGDLFLISASPAPFGGRAGSVPTCLLTPGSAGSLRRSAPGGGGGGGGGVRRARTGDEPLALQFGTSRESCRVVDSMALGHSPSGSCVLRRVSSRVSDLTNDFHESSSALLTGDGTATGTVESSQGGVLRPYTREAVREAAEAVGQEQANLEYRSLLHFIKKEFVDVEEAYLKALDSVCANYLSPLLSMPLVQDIPIVNSMLGSLYNIKACNELFLQELKAVVAAAAAPEGGDDNNEDDADSGCDGGSSFSAGSQGAAPEDPYPYAGLDFGPACLNHMRTFRTLATYFALYEEFCHFVHGCESVHAAHASTKRSLLRTSAASSAAKGEVGGKVEFISFVRRTQAALEKEQDGQEIQHDVSILGLLVRPIQMLAKYRMLLQRLVNSTKESEAGYAHLVKASEEATGVCNYCNQRKIEMDGEQVVAGLEKKWSLSGLSRQGRFWVMDSEMGVLLPVTILPPGDVEEDSPGIPARMVRGCVLFLFNDMLLCVYSTHDDEVTPASPTNSKVFVALDLSEISAIRPDIPADRLQELVRVDNTGDVLVPAAEEEAGGAAAAGAAAADLSSSYCMFPPSTASRVLAAKAREGVLVADPSFARPSPHTTLSISSRHATLDLILPTESLKNLWYETLKTSLSSSRERMNALRKRSVLGVDLSDV
eukprot:Rhum_TRINITY_DN13548_c0_g1::Rhum_TRINITY_DN13548_c0_g1_i1::g.61440::m.61440